MHSEKTLTIMNERGLHARAAAKFVKLAESFESDIVVTKGENAAPGKSIMELLMLGAHLDSSITITADGSDADKAVDALSQLVSEKFGESR